MSGAIVSYQQPATAGANDTQCQLICDQCKTLLNYPQGSTSVHCAICGWIKLVPREGTAVSHVRCDHCRELLMYPGGAHAVKCAKCKGITCLARTSNDLENQLVIVENPLTEDAVGRLVPSLCVGVARKHR